MAKSLWTGQSGVRRIFLLVLLGAVVYYVGRILAPFFSALIWAGILATVSYPAYLWLAARFHRRELASVLTSALVAVVVVLPVLFISFSIAGESVNAYAMLEKIVANGLPAKVAALHNSAVYRTFGAELARMGLPRPDISGAVMRAVRAGSRYLVGHIASIFSGLLNFLLRLFVMFLGLYYFLIYGPRILHELRDLVPLRAEYEEAIAQKFRDVVRATFIGTLAVALIQGVVGSVGFWIFGLSAPLLLGAALALATLVPAIGSALVWVPVGMYYIFTGSEGKGLLFLLVFGGLAGSVDYILRPILIQRGVEIQTLWVFIGVIGGLGVFGPLGVVLGPFFLIILIVILEIYKAEFKKETPQETAS